MSATLVRINKPVVTDPDPKGRAGRLASAYQDVWSELDRDDAHVVDRYVTYLRGRVRALERTLRSTLASDGLSDDARTHTLAILYGAQGSTRDGRLLSPVEFTLVQRYRALDDRSRTLARELFERLEATSERGEE